MPWDADTQLLYEERVAIMVFDGGLDPAEAQPLARQCVEPPPPPPEQPTLFGDDGFSEFRRGMRRMLGDY